MAELRRTHAQRKYAQGMSGPSNSNLVFVSARTASTSLPGTNTTPAPARDRTPEVAKTGMNVHILMDHISTRGLHESDPTSSIALKMGNLLGGIISNKKTCDKEVDQAPMKRNSINLVKMKIPIVKLSQISNNPKRNIKTTEHFTRKRIERTPATPSVKLRAKRPEDKAAEKRVTRSRSSSLTGKALRSRNITAAASPAQAKVIPKKSPIIKTEPKRNPVVVKSHTSIPMIPNTMKRKKILAKKLTIKVAPALRTRSSTVFATSTKRIQDKVIRVSRKRTLKVPSPISKRLRQSVRGPPSSPEYSSDDETPLKFIPKQKITPDTTASPKSKCPKVLTGHVILKPVASPVVANGVDNHIISTDTISLAKSDMVHVRNEPVEPVKEVKVSNVTHPDKDILPDNHESDSHKKPDELEADNSSATVSTGPVLSKIAAGPILAQETRKESNIQGKQSDNTSIDDISKDKDRNEIYDFEDELAVVTSFTKRKRRTESSSQTTTAQYIIYGPDNELHCRLNKDSIKALSSNTSSKNKLDSSIETNGICNLKRDIVPNSDSLICAANIPIDEGFPSISNCDFLPTAPAPTSEALPVYRSQDFPRHRAPSSYDAPVFMPTAAEFKDPLEYIQRISPIASKWGICKIIPPPTTADITPNLPEEVKFNCLNEYLHRMYMRWGPATRELCAIKHNLATHEIKFDRPPLIDGVEVNLPALYSAVQSKGGLKEVLEKAKWEDIAEDLKIIKAGRKVAAQLDKIYCRYLVPYDTLSHADRQSVLELVEREWSRKFKGMVARAGRPTHRQRRLLRASASSDTDEDEAQARVLDECEECVTRGRSMSISYFQNVAGVVRQIYFPGPRAPAPAVVEREYWKHVLLRAQHVCVYAAAVDSGEASLGFPRPRPQQPQPAWNLKVLSDSAGSVLRSLGPVLGLTVPTIHLGMTFSTSCWNRDPHGLPWIEYHHTGAPKIWYGIPDKQSNNFKQAVGKLAPSFCLNKTIWLPSDVLMLPPSLLTENGVSLGKTVQRPGELVVVFPKAYTSSICTGYSVSESVYFGPKDWLTTVLQDFQEAQDSCEPTMFPLEQLLLSIAKDPRSTKPVLLQAYSTLKMLVDDECRHRHVLQQFKVKVIHKPVEESRGRSRADQEECDVCRSALFLSKVTGVSESRVCAKHAVAIAERRSSLEGVELVCRLTDKELGQALDDMEGRIFG